MVIFFAAANLQDLLKGAEVLEILRLKKKKKCNRLLS